MGSCAVCRATHPSDGRHRPRNSASGRVGGEPTGRSAGLLVGADGGGIRGLWAGRDAQVGGHAPLSRLPATPSRRARRSGVPAAWCGRRARDPAVVDLAARLAEGQGGGVLRVLAAAGDDDAHGWATLGRCAPVLHPGRAAFPCVPDLGLPASRKAAAATSAGVPGRGGLLQRGEDAGVVPLGRTLLDGGGDGDTLVAGHHRKVTPSG